MHNDQKKNQKNQNLFILIFFILSLVVAAWLRFYQIDIKPLHHDEGVNSYFLLNLSRSGSYKYDPTNYHGPTLYYLSLIALRTFGENDFALRFWPAIFGVATITLLWSLRHHLGAIGTVVGALLLATSPGLVYFSRDFIHEMSFGCFSLGVVAGTRRYAETKKFAWIALTSISAALLFATKETAIITIAVISLALLCAAIWDNTRQLIFEHRFSYHNLAAHLKHDCLMVMPSADHAFSSIIIFLFINIFFYSSIFTNWQGVTDAIRSIWLWSERSGTEHVKSFWYYCGILIKLELPMIVGSLLAGIFLIWRGTRFWLFVAAWAIGLMLAYSIIGYKTPWLMISFLIPLAMLTGYSAQQLYQVLRLSALRLLWLALISMALIFCWKLTYKLNFEKYDDNNNNLGYFNKLGRKLKFKPYIDLQYGYAYAQTDRDFINLVGSIKDETEKLPTGDHTGIYIASQDYWPLPWYLRDYDQVAYTGSLNVLPGQNPVISQPIIIAGAKERPILDQTPEWRFIERAFTLRPGVELFLYLRDETKGNQK